MIKTAPPPQAEPETTSAPGNEDLPILLTEGEPIGESVFPHSSLEDQQHPEAHRPQGDLAPPPTVGGPSPRPQDAKAGEATLAAALNVNVHKARLQDARDIFDLVNSLSGDGTLLRRSYAEICENIRDFTVAEIPDPNDPTAEPEFLGCGALHLYGPHLAEVRSIVLHPHARGKGAGAALLQALLAESEDHGVATTCLFTRLPTFFERFGFRVAERNAMPDKIYKDCQACPRLYACDEVAMVKGPLPNMAVLGPIKVKQPKLVQVQLTATGTGR
jgi:amino-acid N-acetyltransferase